MARKEGRAMGWGAGLKSLLLVVKAEWSLRAEKSSVVDIRVITQRAKLEPDCTAHNR